MATLREVLVKIFCAKRYATEEDALRARDEARARRGRHKAISTTAGPGDVSQGRIGTPGSGVGFGMPGSSGYGLGQPGPNNGFGTRSGIGF